MLNLNDPKWETFEGGYRIPYNASIPLTKLENAADATIIKSIINELWEELHHQGDVGIASYMSVPHLIRIAKKRELFDVNIIGLITVIEIQRHKNNPQLPNEYEDEYFTSLSELKDLALSGINKEWDLELASCTLSAIAASKGQIKLANAILLMDSEDMIDELLDGY
jgi:hypothetical protein